jgi:hypothetical protein
LIRAFPADSSRRCGNSTIMRLSIRHTLMTIALVLSFMASPALVSGQGREDGSLDRAVLDLFSDYFVGDDLWAIVRSHARRPVEEAHVAFYSTWFLDGNVRVPMGTIIGDDGRVKTFARSRWKQRPNVDLRSFMTTVRTLPETTRPDALANIVIVSFRLDGKWQTRLYDRSKPPKELVDVYRIAQSPLNAY